MSTNRNIVEMVEAIRKGTGGSNSADGGCVVGKTTDN